MNPISTPYNFFANFVISELVFMLDVYMYRNREVDNNGRWVATSDLNCHNRCFRCAPMVKDGETGRGRWDGGTSGVVALTPPLAACNLIVLTRPSSLSLIKTISTNNLDCCTDIAFLRMLFLRIGMRNISTLFIFLNRVDCHVQCL